MKLYLQENCVSNFGNYCIFDEKDHMIYSIEGNLGKPNLIVIRDRNGRELGTVKTLLYPHRYEFYQDERIIGHMQIRHTCLKTTCILDFEGMKICSRNFGLHYQIKRNGTVIARILESPFRLRGAYEFHVKDESNALSILMIAISIVSDHLISLHKPVGIAGL